MAPKRNPIKKGLPGPGSETSSERKDDSSSAKEETSSSSNQPPQPSSSATRRIQAPAPVPPAPAPPRLQPQPGDTPEDLFSPLRNQALNSPIPRPNEPSPSSRFREPPRPSVEVRRASADALSGYRVNSPAFNAPRPQSTATSSSSGQGTPLNQVATAKPASRVLKSTGGKTPMKSTRPAATGKRKRGPSESSASGEAAQPDPGVGSSKRTKGSIATSSTMKGKGRQIKSSSDSSHQTGKRRKIQSKKDCRDSTDDSSAVPSPFDDSDKDPDVDKMGEMVSVKEKAKQGTKGR